MLKLSHIPASSAIAEKGEGIAWDAVPVAGCSRCKRLFLLTWPVGPASLKASVPGGGPEAEEAEGGAELKMEGGGFTAALEANCMRGAESLEAQTPPDTSHFREEGML